MNNRQLILFGITFLLFIFAQPELFVKIPPKYNTYFIISHCLVFTLFFSISYHYMNNVQENFTENETLLFTTKREEIKKEFKKQGIDDLDKMSDEKVTQIMTNVTQGMSDEEIKKLQQYMLSNETDLKNNPESIQSRKDKNVEKFKKFEEKINHLGEMASIDQIKLFDSLSINQQDALGKILENMNNSEIEKYLKLDVETLKKSIQDVLESV